MKTLFISNMHGENTCNFVEQQLDEGIDKVVLLGDYDSTQGLEDAVRIPLEKRFRIGNHQFYYVDGSEVGGSLIEYSSGEYIPPWERNAFGRGFVFGQTPEKIGDSELALKQETGEEARIVYSHTITPCPRQKSFESSWQRIASKNDKRAIFDRMKKGNYELLFRGCDPRPCTIVLNESDQTIEKPLENRVRVIEGNRYVINVGSFYLGSYTVFDSKRGEIEHGNRVGIEN